ncbi:MAG: class I SAM-dependent methyltransferase [Methylobacteriaceae bacterium]|jgi:SAM-dependent methyltransferase|nr:class I SAM-dependent methyltransferase [Methylobacteriaceae bacterium]
MTNKLRCVICNGGELSAVDDGLKCNVCGGEFPFVSGIPYFGRFTDDDFQSLLEIAVVAEKSILQDRDVVENWRKACAGYYQDQDLKRVEEQLGPGGLRFFFNRYAEWLQQKVLFDGESLEGRCVLDVGAGSGFDSVGLVERGMTVTALEYNASLAAAGKEVVPEADWVCGFSHLLPFKNNSFDFVVCNAALHHMLHVPATLAEFIRVVRPGGTVFTISDSFRGVGTDKSHDLDVFNDHEAVLAGVNESLVDLKDVFSVLDRYKDALDITVFSNMVYGVQDALGLPLDYTCRWDYAVFRERFSRCDGAFSLRIRKKSDIVIDPPVQKNGVYSPKLFFECCRTSVNAVAGFIAGNPPPEQYVNTVSFPFVAHNKFLLMSGWRRPLVPAAYREGFGRVNSFWSRAEEQNTLLIDLEVPSAGPDNTVLLSMDINGAKRFEQELLRGVKYRISLNIGDVPAGQPFAATVKVPEDLSFDSRLIFFYDMRLAPAQGVEPVAVSETGRRPGLAALLATTYKECDALDVVLLPGNANVTHLMELIRDSGKTSGFLKRSPSPARLGMRSIPWRAGLCPNTPVTATVSLCCRPPTSVRRPEAQTRAVRMC